MTYKQNTALFFIIAVIGCGIIACSAGCPGPTPRPVQDIVDCAKLEGSQNWEAAKAQLILDITSGHWGQLAADAEVAGAKFGYDTARCVAMELIQQYLTAKQGENLATHDASDAAEQIRAHAGGKGVTFHTSQLGDL